MSNQVVPKTDDAEQKAPRFTRIERIVLASGACALSLWIGGLVWVGYKLVAAII